MNDDYCPNPKCKIRIIAVVVIGNKAYCPQCGAFLGEKVKGVICHE